MKINRSGSAVWTGGLKDGKGAITTQSGALTDYPYGFSSRFEGVAGSNPEELIAASRAACFTMALSLMLGAGTEAVAIEGETPRVLTLARIRDAGRIAPSPRKRGEVESGVSLTG